MDMTASSRGGKDYFSLLPNEILQDIFDRAVSSYKPPQATISKRLLPFFQASLYRRLCLDTLDSIQKVLTTLQAKPYLGRPTHEAEVMYYAHPNSGNDRKLDSTQILHLLSFLPNLKEFYTTWYLALPPTFKHNSISNTLNSLSVGVTPVEFGSIELADVARSIAALSTIEWLEITGWNIYEESGPPLTDEFRNVKTLTIIGGGVAESKASFLINNCPRLEELSLLLDPLSEDIDSDFDDVLSSVDASCCASLTSLTLYSSFDNSTGLGSSLSKFTSLRHLSLHNLLVFQELHEAVLSLSNLETFDVASTDYEWNDLLELVEGPTRLANLRTLKLNQVNFVTWTGTQFDPDNSLHVALFKEGKFKRFRGWQMENIEGADPEYWIGCRNLVKAARQAGIKVEGTIYKARRVFLLYLLELNNLAIAEAYFNRQFNQISAARSKASEFGFELPDLDFDSFDLELVKVDKPPLGWFALTLKDKVNSGDL
ncbi:hypothetical protein JCM5350_008049 [Sporobolomyces pararoseus]